MCEQLKLTELNKPRNYRLEIERIRMKQRAIEVTMIILSIAAAVAILGWLI